jgi:hypothetical protein
VKHQFDRSATGSFLKEMLQPTLALRAEDPEKKREKERNRKNEETMNDKKKENV